MINQVKKIKEIGKRITSRDTGKLDILKHAQQFYKSYPECVLNLFKVCIIVYSLGLGQNIIWKKKKYTNMTSILWALSFHWNRSSYPECPETYELLSVKKMPNFTQKTHHGLLDVKIKSSCSKLESCLTISEIFHKVVHEQKRN